MSKLVLRKEYPKQSGVGGWTVMEDSIGKSILNGMGGWAVTVDRMGGGGMGCSGRELFPIKATSQKYSDYSHTLLLHKTND